MMPPANATKTGGALANDHEAGSRLAAAGKPSINAALPMSRTNINGCWSNRKVRRGRVDLEIGLELRQRDQHRDAIPESNQDGVRRELDDLARRPPSPKIVCHKPASRTQRNMATTTRSVSPPTAGMASSAVVRLASSRASLTRDVVTMNEDVANSADTQQETMAPHSPAVAPATAYPGPSGANANRPDATQTGRLTIAAIAPAARSLRQTVSVDFVA